MMHMFILFPELNFTKPKIDRYFRNVYLLVEFDSDHPVDKAYREITKIANYADLEITSFVKNEQIVIKGKRDYKGSILWSLVVVGLLLIGIGVIIAIIYYWTRPFQKIIIDLTPNDTGSIISIHTPNKIYNILIHDIEKRLGSKTA